MTEQRGNGLIAQATKQHRRFVMEATVKAVAMSAADVAAARQFLVNVTRYEWLLAWGFLLLLAATLSSPLCLMIHSGLTVFLAIVQAMRSHTRLAEAEKRLRHLHDVVQGDNALLGLADGDGRVAS